MRMESEELKSYSGEAEAPPSELMARMSATTRTLRSESDENKTVADAYVCSANKLVCCKDSSDTASTLTRAFPVHANAYFREYAGLGRGVESVSCKGLRVGVVIDVILICRCLFPVL